VSAAYYGMLYAARAALSERDLYAKTHGGAWSQFADTFVRTGEFDAGLAGSAGRAQEKRLLGDYEARPPTPGEAATIVADAEAFVAAVEEMLGE